MSVLFMITYTVIQLYPTSYMLKNTNSLITPELKVVEEQIILHFKALIMDIQILVGQGRDIIRGLPSPLFVKSVVFRKQGRGKPLRLPRPFPPRTLLSVTIAKK